MTNSQKYRILALVGPSGSGKDSLLNALVDKCKDKFHKIINCTTRPIRENEQDGVHYYFLSNEEFAQKVLNFEMIEATNFNDWFYGTLKTKLSNEKINIGVFNPASVSMIMEQQDIEIYPYLIQVSDKERLIRQLQREKDPNIQEIIRRYNADLLDFSDLEFSYNVIYNETQEDFIEAVSLLSGLCETLDKTD